MKLRNYQVDAVAAVNRWLFAHRDRVAPRSGVVAAPTGSGKTVLFASLLGQWFEMWPDQFRALIVVPQKELATQAEAKIRATFERLQIDASVGVCCAGESRFELDADVVIGSPLTLRSRMADLHANGAIRVAVIDECHLVSPDEAAVLPSVLSALAEVHPKLRTIGFSATPFRLDSGLIYGEGQPFDDLIHRVEMGPLIEAGHLAPIRPFAGSAAASIRTEDATKVRVRAGDFSTTDLEREATDEERVAAAVDDVLTKAKDRRTILVFACSVAHAEVVCQAFRERDESAELVTGETPDLQRRATLTAFAEGRIRFVVNVGCLTTGVDVPAIDCIVALRPTLSSGLWLQMIGRGTRTAEGKADCLLLDFANNTLRHGPIDQPDPECQGRVGRSDRAPVRECERCSAIIGIRLTECPECGHLREVVMRANHDTTASAADPLAAPMQLSVRAISVVVKKPNGEPPRLSVRVDTVELGRVYAGLDLEHWRHPDARHRWRATKATRLWQRIVGTSPLRWIREAEAMGLDWIARRIESRVSRVTVKGNFVHRWQLRAGVQAGVDG